MTFDNIGRVLDAVRTGFGAVRVLVVGDLMLDEYLWGEVTRTSPEAPVPVVLLGRTTEAPGGAANVAVNLHGLGLEVIAGGFVGDDDKGDRLTSLLALSGVEPSGVVRLSGTATVTKTRIIGGHQQMLRVDTESPTPPDEPSRVQLISRVREQLRRDIKIVVLSDYAKGALEADTCHAIIAVASALGIPVLVDPKGLDYNKYAGATAISPNLTELALATATPLHRTNDVLRSGRGLLDALDLAFIVVTRGKHGVTLLEPQHSRDFPAVAREVYDVVGAGDTILATLAAGMTAGLGMNDLMRLVNIAAGVVVRKVGTTPILRDELLRELEGEPTTAENSKICDLPTIEHRVRRWQEGRDTIVFTNGCFDILHAGHVSYLEQARRLGDRLVVGLNTDRSVKALKGSSRPVIGQDDRATILAGLTSVDAVVLFDEDTPITMIEALRPNVIAKGDDYLEHEVAGAKQIKSWGGRVVLLPLLDGRSSSKIVRDIGTHVPADPERP